MAPPVTDGPAFDGSADAGEDDYMSMVISEPTTHGKETSIQRRARKRREAELKSRNKSKAEREADSITAREAALSTAMPTANKGFAMMAKLGFKPGGVLGKTGNEGRREPIHLAMKEDRSGIGLDSEKKRKIREEMEGETKRVKAEETGYRERMRREREERRMEGQVIGAMKVAERLDLEAEERGREELGDDAARAKLVHKPLKNINVLWRGLIRHRLEQERERRMRHDLQQSLSRLPTYNDPDEDNDDKQALGRGNNTAIVEEEVEEEDLELDGFNSLEVAERLDKLVRYLRSQYRYCFWCKFQYPDESMDGCPGTTEEDHD